MATKKEVIAKTEPTSKKRQQLILITDSDPRKTIVAGVGMYTYYLAKYAVKKYDVLFLGKKKEGEIIEQVPYGVMDLTSKPGQKNPFFYMALRKLARKMSLSDDAIIHAQRPDWLLPFKKAKGKKIFTLHGSHYKNIRLKKGRFAALVYRQLERKAFKIADEIIAVDSETKKEYAAWFPKYADKIKHIPIGMDSQFFTPGNKQKIRKQLGIPVKQPVYAFVGRLSKEKRHHLMIQHLKQGENLILIGTGEEEEQLKAQAQRQKKDVLFTGPLPPSQFRPYLQAADVVLIFSTHEGLPTTVLEGLCCGCTIACTKVGELPNLIKQAHIGYLVKNGNYRTAMEQAMKDSKRLSPICRKKGEEFDWRKVARRIFNEAYK